jgi:hypothetical protein
MEVIMVFLLLIILSRIQNINTRPSTSIYNYKQNIKKWKNILNYSSSLGATAIPLQDQSLVANLFEQAERYCIDNSCPKEINNWIIDIRKNYKNATYDFGYNNRI